MINKKFSLKNKFCLITGAAGLLGLEHAKAILEIEGNIILTDKDVLKLKKKIKELKFYFSNSKIYYYKMDVTKPKEIKGVFNKLVKNKIDIDILINNAAIDSKVIAGKKSKTNKFESFSLNEWEKQISVGLTGSMLCSQVFGAQMSKRKKGVILNIASDLSILAPDQRLYSVSKKKKSFKPVTYSVIKHGLIGLTKYISTYWPEKNIRCNSLSPGSVNHEQSLIFKKKIKKLIPLNRMADKDEYKSAVQFLCSDASSYMTGQNLIIDGGRSIW
jgi:NAD(P)-dependent dehydrogenase (short-subunit alcohol dehydrogenase family)